MHLHKQHCIKTKHLTNTSLKTIIKHTTHSAKDITVFDFICTAKVDYIFLKQEYKNA